MLLINLINKTQTRRIKQDNQKMFVKQAYEKRLKKQQEDISNLLHLKKQRPPKIGSIKNDKINYDRQEQYFSKDDIPVYARTVKQQIKNFIDPDHLGLRKRNWNTSVSVPKNLQADQTHQQKLLKIKLGFMDQPLPKYQEPIIYKGTQLRDDYTNWNVSVQVSGKQNRQNLMKKTMSALENTKLRQQNYLTQYMDPISSTSMLISSFKQKHQQQAQLRQQLKAQYQFQNPTSSEQKTNAAIFRLAYENSIKQKKDQIQDKFMKTDFRATLSMTQKSKMKLVTHHNGIWQRFVHKSAGEEEEYFAWSCCLNQDRKSIGCVKKIHDANKWNLTSFNNL